MPSWYALHVIPQSEPIVSRKLGEVGIESYYPSRMVDSKRKYRPQIEQRFFPGYVFAHFNLRDRTPVIQIPQVIRILGWGGNQPAEIPASEIESVRILANSPSAACCPMVAGENITITSGPFQGSEGIVVRSKGKAHLVVTIAMLGRSVMAEIDASDCAVNSSSAGRASGAAPGVDALLKPFAFGD